MATDQELLAQQADIVSRLEVDPRLTGVEQAALKAMMALLAQYMRTAQRRKVLEDMVNGHVK